MLGSAHSRVQAVKTSLLYDQSFAFRPRKARTSEARRETRPMVRTTELRRLLQHWYKLKGDRKSVV